MRKKIPSGYSNHILDINGPLAAMDKLFSLKGEFSKAYVGHRIGSYIRMLGRNKLLVFKGEAENDTWEAFLLATNGSQLNVAIRRWVPEDQVYFSSLPLYYDHVANSVVQDETCFSQESNKVEETGVRVLSPADTQQDFYRYEPREIIVSAEALARMANVPSWTVGHQLQLDGAIEKITSLIPAGADSSRLKGLFEQVSGELARLVAQPPKLTVPVLADFFAFMEARDFVVSHVIVNPSQIQRIEMEYRGTGSLWNARVLKDPNLNPDIVLLYARSAEPNVVVGPFTCSLIPAEVAEDGF